MRRMINLISMQNVINFVIPQNALKCKKYIATQTFCNILRRKFFNVCGMTKFITFCVDMRFDNRRKMLLFYIILQCNIFRTFRIFKTFCGVTNVAVCYYEAHYLKKSIIQNILLIY